MSLSKFAARTSTTLSLALLLNGCDLDGKKDCDWTLEPEPKLKGQVDEGFIPVCARNRETMKEDCRFQATLAYAKEVFGRKFRHVDLNPDKSTFPRTLAKIKFCDGKMD